MIELFVDSGVWIDFFADRGSWQVEDLSRRLLAGEQIGLTDIVLTELLQGARDDGELQCVSGRACRCCTTIATSIISPT